jgi:hypothetical protein
MLGIKGEPAEAPQEITPRPSAAGEGLLFLGVLGASWLIALGVGWVIWRLSPF